MPESPLDTLAARLVDAGLDHLTLRDLAVLETALGVDLVRVTTPADPPRRPHPPTLSGWVSAGAYSYAYLA